MALGIKKDDMVVVISGRNKGERGRVLRVMPSEGRLVVEGVNRVKRHQRPTPKMPQGGILEREAPIHVSKVMLLDTKADKPSRIRAKTTPEGKKVRVTARTGTTVDG